MKGRHLATGLSLIVAASVLLPGVAQAQLQRRSAGGTPPDAPAGTPAKARVPYAGTWEGTRTMKDGPGANDPVPIVMVFDADSTGAYSGYSLLPNNARAPHRKTAVKDGTMTWEQPNSGGGRWVYSARLAGRDSVSGSFVLLDWPQGGGAQPSGTFALVRRQSSR